MKSVWLCFMNSPIWLPVRAIHAPARARFQPLRPLIRSGLDPRAVVIDARRVGVGLDPEHSVGGLESGRHRRRGLLEGDGQDGGTRSAHRHPEGPGLERGRPRLRVARIERRPKGLRDPIEFDCR